MPRTAARTTLVRVFRVASALLVCSAAACANLPPFPTARTFGLGGDDTADIVAIAPTTNISLSEAIRSATNARPGDAVRAALAPGDDGGAKVVAFRVWVLSGGGAYDVSVDAQSGRVLYVRTGDEDDTREISALRGAAGPDRRPLEDLVALAVTSADGAAAWSAAYLYAETPRTARVSLARDGRSLDVLIDARTGVVR